MAPLLHDLILSSANDHPEAEALRHKKATLTYRELADAILKTAQGLSNHGLGHQDRVAIYLPKRFETVISFFAVSMAGGVFVPINPLLKAAQVTHILQDCNVRFLITSSDRARLLKESLLGCHDLQTLILIDDSVEEFESPKSVAWKALGNSSNEIAFPPIIDTDMAAILYTSGSTGKPKGVMLSHKNMVTGAKSVAQYLGNRSDDRLLAVLPFSFDYGFSQLTTAFYAGGCAVLMDYLLPRDVIRTIIDNDITGLAAVPSLWIQLAQLEWPDDAKKSLRYITSSGGGVPSTTIATLRHTLPGTELFLMYGLTEAFRSTYLPPDEIDKRPNSMGKAIPNVEIMVVREDGTPCAAGEPGELVHRGPLVALGYWNDTQGTAKRFRPVPTKNNALFTPETAVWSGDTVKMDEDGYVYFVGRNDDMIKTSGYRVSPTEVEEVIYASALVSEAVALGIPHPTLGEAILVIATPKEAGVLDSGQLINYCKRELPNFMTPLRIEKRDALPRNPNGKIDRKILKVEYQGIFNAE